MRVRLGLFVEDMETSIGFYTCVLGFEVAPHEPGDYASLRNGGDVLGIGPISKLPEEGGYFTRDIASPRRGSGSRSSWRSRTWTSGTGAWWTRGIPSSSHRKRGPGA